MKIGIIEFDSFEGVIIYPAMQSRKFEYAGEDGSLLVLDGKRERLSTVTTTRTYLDDAAAQAAENDIYQMAGTLDTVEDAFGRTHDNVFIDDVDATIREVIGPSTNATHTRQITAVWKLIKRIDYP